MPVVAKYYRDPDLQYLRISGELTLHEIRQQFANAPDQPGFYTGIPTLVDLRGLRGTEACLADLMSLRDRLGERHGVTGRPHKMALFVDCETAFGIARIFETLCTQTDAIDARLFQSLPEALAFLGAEGVEIEQRDGPGPKALRA